MTRILKNQKFHKIRWLLAAGIAASLLLSVFVQPVYASAPGNAGADQPTTISQDTQAETGNISWNINSGVLRISGSGSIGSYTENAMAPWYSQRDSITAVQIESGITGIGDLAFYECQNLNTVTMPDSIQHIGDMAFAGCSSLQGINLGSELISIGDHAFSRCESLTSIRLPEGLLSIGYQAFYRCSSLTSIRIPKTVSNLDSSVFAYCTSLMQATIEGPIQELPRWTFYGCSALKNVSMPSTVQNVGENAFKGCEVLENTYHDGVESDRNHVSDQVKNDVPTFPGVQEGDKDSITSSTGTSTSTSSNGETVETNKEVIETENSNVNVTIQTTTPPNPSVSNKTEMDVTIDATIENEAGWQEVVDKVEEYSKLPERLENDTTAVGTIKVNIQLKGEVTSIPSGILSSLAGSKVELNVTAPDNSTWSMNMAQIDKDSLSNAYDLSFTLTKNEKPSKAEKELIGSAMSFRLSFDENVPFQVTVRVPLGHSYGGHYATICQKPFMKEWEVLQSSVIDYSGNAYFYLESVDKRTDYLVVIDMLGVDATQALIPDSMAEQYGNLTDAEGNKYVLTGTQSSWGITFKQLTLILIGIIVGCGVIVGIIMKVIFARSASRARMEQLMAAGASPEEIFGKKPKKKAKPARRGSVDRKRTKKAK